MIDKDISQGEIESVDRLDGRQDTANVVRHQKEVEVRLSGCASSWA